MSANGNLEFIAAKISAIDRKLDAANDERLDSFKALLSSIETSLADMLENIEKGGGAAAIEAMTKAIGSLRMPAVQFTAPPFDLRPTFNVPPAEVPKLPPVVLAPESVAAVASALRDINVNVEAVMPQGLAPTTVFNAPRVASWEVRIKGSYGAPDRVMTITPSYKD